jgi:hypothetical protein
MVILCLSNNFQIGEVTMMYGLSELEIRYLREYPFPVDELRSHPNVRGWWWVDQYSNGQWVIVKVVELYFDYGVVYIVGEQRPYSTKEFRGKWAGPIFPKPFGML